MPFEEGFLDTIVGVSWGGRLFLCVYADGITANNSQPSNSTQIGDVGGNPLDCFVGDLPPVTLTSQVLADPTIDIALHFEQTLAQDFSDSQFGLHLFDVKRLLSTFGPDAPITGSIAISNAPLTQSDTTVFFATAKAIRNRVVSFLFPGAVPPQPVYGIPIPFVGTFKSVGVNLGDTGSLDFSADPKTLVVS